MHHPIRFGRAPSCSPAPRCCSAARRRPSANAANTNETKTEAAAATAAGSAVQSAPPPGEAEVAATPAPTGGLAPLEKDQVSGPGLQHP